MARTTSVDRSPPDDEKETRRDFLYLVTVAAGAVGTGIAVWPLIDSVNPSAEVLAVTTAEFDLEPVQLGQRITVVWRGKPIFIDHRPPKEIARARADDQADLKDPEADSARVKRPEWLVVIGICTHLGCIPKGQQPGDPVGDFGGWFCPCHGSHYDTSGRIRKGPAPKNLIVSPYEFLDNLLIRISSTNKSSRMRSLAGHRIKRNGLRNTGKSLTQKGAVGSWGGAATCRSNAQSENYMSYYTEF